MLKKSCAALLLIFALCANVLSAYAAPAPGPAAPSLNVNAKAAVLMEPVSGVLLLSQNPHEKLAPASVTKVMSMLLIYEAIADGRIKWDDVVTVSDHAAGMGGSQIFLEPMEQQTVRDLTKAVVIASANDAVVALGEYIAGSEEGFVLMMNNRARDLGLRDTHFVNACGLDADGHVTSAYDIALMTRELMLKHPEVFEFTKIWMDSITHRTARGESEFGLTNTNRLIRSYTGATGLKTGSTAQALYCIAATATRDGMDQIAVVLGAPDPGVRFGEAMKMLDYGFANYSVKKGEAADTVKDTVKIFKGDMETIGVAVKEQVTCLVPKGKTAEMESKIELLDTLSAPAPKGTKAGEIVYTFEGKEVGRSDLVTVEDVAKASLGNILGRTLRDWF